MAYTIKVVSHGRTIKTKENDLLADRLQQAGIPLSLYCHKRGLCGKCYVEIVKGRRPPLGGKERTWLKQKNLSQNHRLACLYKIRGDVEVNVPAQSTFQEVPILPVVGRSAVSPDPAVKKYLLELKKPEIGTPSSLFDLLPAGLGAKHLHISSVLLKELGSKMDEGGFQVTITLHREIEIIEVAPGVGPENIFGLAIDVGTTTLVVELIDLSTGKSVATQAALNSQARLGADVISRISYALSGSDKAAELRGLVLGTLNKMIGRLLKENHIPLSSVYEVVVAGNTTMNHLLLGVPVETLAAAPYHAVFSHLPYFAAEEVGLRIHPRGKVYIVPNIKSFVGGDITAGLTALRLYAKRGNYLFIDLGTNGEIVLKVGRDLLATSTAAGPAFEGMNISCGMPALPGAIYKAEGTGPPVLSTIGNEPAQGICGTGLIDLVAAFLESGAISVRGAIQNPEKRLSVEGSISLTQDDIRQMQLACAAVKTGIRMMLGQNRLRVEDLDGIYIAGAFGNYLNIRNSMAIGLLPRLDESKIIFIGNSSLAGARLLLVSQRERERAEALVQKIRYVSLASGPEFQDLFIKALDFASWP